MARSRISKRENVGRVVSGYFKSHGIKQIEAAKRLGVKRQSVANQLQRDLFKKDVADKYAREFGFNSLFLLTGRGAITNDKVERIASLRAEIQVLRRIVAQQDAEIRHLKGY